MLSAKRSHATKKTIAIATSLALATLSIEGCGPMQTTGDSQGDAKAAQGWSAVQYSTDPCSESYKSEQAFSKSMQNALIGGAIGAAAGALFANMTGRKASDGAKLGGLVGLLAGAITGYTSAQDATRRQCELYKVAMANGAQAKFVTLQQGANPDQKVGEIAVTPNEGLFFPDTERLTPKGKAYYLAMARQYTSPAQLASFEQSVRKSATQYRKLVQQYGNYSADDADKKALESKWSELRLVLTGHTDDGGDSASQIDLSEKRARVVAELFKDAGVPEDHLFYQGAGAAYPIADNHTAEGRALNRRVEIVVLYGDAALNAYPMVRNTQHEFFRPIEEVQPVAVVAQQASPATKPKPKSKPQQPARAPTKPAAKAPVVSAPTVTAEQRVVPQPHLEENFVEFGGIQFSSFQPNLANLIGNVVPRSGGFSLAGLFGIGPAQASSGPVANCVQDDPNRYRTTDIKRLRSGQAVGQRYIPREHFPGLYGTAWMAPAGDHLIGLNGVAVSPQGDVVSLPRVQIYKEYGLKDRADAAGATPDYSLNGQTVAFVGEKGLLFREFFGKSDPLQCVDVVFPKTASSSATGGQLFYQRAGLVYTVAVPFKAVPK